MELVLGVVVLGEVEKNGTTLPDLDGVAVVIDNLLGGEWESEFSQGVPRGQLIVQEQRVELTAGILLLGLISVYLQASKRIIR